MEKCGFGVVLEFSWGLSFGTGVCKERGFLSLFFPRGSGFSGFLSGSLSHGIQWIVSLPTLRHILAV